MTQVFLNGMLRRPGKAYDYVLSGNTIKFSFKVRKGDFLDVVEHRLFLGPKRRSAILDRDYASFSEIKYETVLSSA